MIQIKISGATPKGGKSLCHTCKNAVSVKGQNCEELVVCNAGMFARNGCHQGPVTFKVSECGGFHPINVPWLHEMEQLAWTIEARRRGPAGFSEPTEMEVVVTRPKRSGAEQIPG